MIARQRSSFQDGVQHERAETVRGEHRRKNDVGHAVLRFAHCRIRAGRFSVDGELNPASWKQFILYGDPMATKTDPLLIPHMGASQSTSEYMEGSFFQNETLAAFLGDDRYLLDECSRLFAQLKTDDYFCLRFDSVFLVVINRALRAGESARRADAPA